MDLMCTDDLQTQSISIAQDLCPLENTSEVKPEGRSGVFDASNEDATKLKTQSENVNSTSFKMSEEFILCSATTDKDIKPCDFIQHVAFPDGVHACLTNDSSASAPSTALPQAAPSVSTIETMSEQEAIASCASYNSDDDHAFLVRSSSQSSNDSSSDVTASRLSDLFIFESEAHDFIVSPEPNPQGIKASQSMTLSQTVADISFKTHDVDDSSKALIKYDPDFPGNQIIAQCESDGMNSLIRPPGKDACDVAQGNVDVGSTILRSDSPIELWIDACQYFSVDNSDDRNVSGQSVMQDSVSTATSDFVPPEEAQRSGYSRNACDMIGWTSDDTSWGAPVERWSSVDSWASALSDWAEIISSPAEDLTAAFTEIGAEIDALTQALAEVTTQIETELRGETPENEVEELIMGVQDKPLDTQNFTGQSCMTQEKDVIKPVCTTKEDLEKNNSSYRESQKQTMGSCEVNTFQMCSEDMKSKAAFGAEKSLLDLGFITFKTDCSNEVTLNIVEDTDWEYQKASEGLHLGKPGGDIKCEVKDEDGYSLLDLAPKQDTERLCTPAETLNVTRQRKDTLGLSFVNTLPHSNVYVPEENSEPSLNVHVQPKTLEGFDGACQVEPLWESPKFIIPFAPLNIGSSLFTQATNSSLNGDQEAKRLVLNQDRDSVSSEALDWTESDDGNEFSSESSEDIAWSKQSKKDCSRELQADEATLRSFTQSKSVCEESQDLLNLSVIPKDHFIVCEEKRVAYFTLDLYDPFAPWVTHTPPERMPHKTHKSSSEGKTRSKKERSGCQSHGVHSSSNQENLSHNVEEEQQPHTFKENVTGEKNNRLEHSEPVIETVDAQKKEMGRRHSKKKKKHPGKSSVELLTEKENETKADQAKADIVKDKLVAKATDQPVALKKNIEKQETKTVSKDKLSQNISVPNNNEDIIKKRRLSQDKFGKLVSSLESKLTTGDRSKGVEDKADVGATRRKAYSEVVKQKSVKPTGIKVVQPIQAASVSGDPQSLCLWCQFSDVLTDHTVTWRKDRMALTEIKRSAGDESRVSLTISNASQKDLGKYQCELRSAHKTVTLDFLLTYELLSEIVVPATPKTTPAVPPEVGHEEESVHCSSLMFKEDFLLEQYFGESHSASIVTEKIHFGEGMHRRAFRTTLQAGQVPLLVPGDPCVLKVHNAISYGTKNNEELVQKNFSLAVEECQVQNTAREYIKVYTAVAESFEAFGPVPEIIPIYLVHRPSNDIPYATLEEELIGDFVKYSVKDGKEINLMRKDSEAGQKCCAFQHWVYHYTEGNLLVTDMQGVGMRLTDVGIATCKKGYKGFKGNCATSFIDQFKALHQCNRYCEILGLNSLQPKPKKMAPVTKSKAPPGAAPKKKIFEPNVKGKS